MSAIEYFQVAIHDHLLQRPPFLFVDTAEVDESQTRIRARHSFESSAPYFKGHFPADPVTPGVILLEAMAQTARLLVNLRHGHIAKGFLLGVEMAKFNLVVRPPQEVVFNCQLLQENDSSIVIANGNIIYSFKCAAFIGDQRCARAHIKLIQTAGNLPGSR